MTREQTFEKLNEVFRDVFDDDSICVTDTTTSDDIEDWDSLEHINLIAAVEQEFQYGAGRHHEECGRDGGYHYEPAPGIRSG